MAAVITAYAAVADAETAAQFFRIAVQKLVKARAVIHSLHPGLTPYRQARRLTGRVLVR